MRWIEKRSEAARFSFGRAAPFVRASYYLPLVPPATSQIPVPRKAPNLDATTSPPRPSPPRANAGTLTQGCTSHAMLRWLDDGLIIQIEDSSNWGGAVPTEERAPRQHFRCAQIVFTIRAASPPKGSLALSACPRSARNYVGASLAHWLGRCKRQSSSLTTSLSWQIRVHTYFAARASSVLLPLTKGRRFCFSNANTPPWSSRTSLCQMATASKSPATSGKNHPTRLSS